MIVYRGVSIMYKRVIFCRRHLADVSQAAYVPLRQNLSESVPAVHYADSVVRFIVYV